MLVDLDASDRAQVQHLAAADHCLRQGQCLGTRHASNADGHEPRGHLVVRNLSTQITVQQEIDLVSRVLAAITLAADHLECVTRRCGRDLTYDGISSLCMAWRRVPGRSA